MQVSYWLSNVSILTGAGFCEHHETALVRNKNNPKQMDLWFIKHVSNDCK